MATGVPHNTDTAVGLSDSAAMVLGSEIPISVPEPGNLGLPDKPGGMETCPPGAGAGTGQGMTSRGHLTRWGPPADFPRPPAGPYRLPGAPSGAQIREEIFYDFLEMGAQISGEIWKSGNENRPENYRK